MTKRTRSFAAIGTASLTAVATALTMVATGGASTDRSQRVADVGQVVAQVQQLLADNRIVNAAVNGSTLDIKVSASGSASTALALWDGRLLARAIATQLVADGQPAVTAATISDSSGQDLNGGSESIAQGPAASSLTSDACKQASANGGANGLAIAKAATLPLLGGTCVFVIHPDNASDFLALASDRAGAILSAVPAVADHPYITEAVDASGTPTLVLGWVPGIGSGDGEGVGWVQPGSSSSAVLGSGIATASVGH